MPRQIGKITLTADRGLATIELEKSAQVTADELDEIIALLALTRANMLPIRPDEDLKPTDKVSALPSIRWHVDLDHDAPTQIRLYLLNLGLGWVSIPLTEEGVAEMTLVMQRVLRHRPNLQ